MMTMTLMQTTKNDSDDLNEGHLISAPCRSLGPERTSGMQRASRSEMIGAIQYSQHGSYKCSYLYPASVNFKMQRGLVWSTWLTFSYLQILLRLKPFRQDLRFKPNTCFHTFHILVNASVEL